MYAYIEPYKVKVLYIFDNCLLTMKQIKQRISYIKYIFFQKLDIQGLKDDPFLNVLDWSSQCLVAIGASSFVYYANASLYDSLDHQVHIFKFYINYTIIIIRYSY